MKNINRIINDPISIFSSKKSEKEEEKDQDQANRKINLKNDETSSRKQIYQTTRKYESSKSRKFHTFFLNKGTTVRL